MKDTNEDRVSRFITTEDTMDANIFYTIPGTWWSRLYEYIWAGKFTNNDDVVLDVATGLGHPFKFYLATKVKKVFACDNDPRILSNNKIMDDIRLARGNDDISDLDHSVMNSVTYAMCDIAELPYEDKMFNKLFCISVFEHLMEDLQLNALKEFVRVLKDDGLIVMTVDYPDVNIEKIMEFMKEAKLKFYGQYNFDKPDNVLTCNYWAVELNCIRLLLCKE